MPLLARVAQGDRAAIEQCIDTYGNLVWSLARRYCGQSADAEDAVQEIFIDLWKSAGRYQESMGTEATFVATIARRRIIDRLRSAGRRRELAAVPVEVAEVERPQANAMERDADAAKAAQALGTLRPEQQKVLKLHIFQGMTHQEISDATGMPLGTVKTFVRRGLQQVRQMLGVGGEA